MHAHLGGEGCNPPKICLMKMNCCSPRMSVGGTMRLFSACELELRTIEKENSAKATYAGRSYSQSFSLTFFLNKDCV